MSALAVGALTPQLALPFGVAEPVDPVLSGVTGGPATGGTGGGGGRGDTAMTVLAVSGIGTGTALLAVLGVWRVVARRRLGSP